MPSSDFNLGKIDFANGIYGKNAVEINKQLENQKLNTVFGKSGDAPIKADCETWALGELLNGGLEADGVINYSVEFNKDGSIKSQGNDKNKEARDVLKYIRENSTVIDKAKGLLNSAKEGKTVEPEAYISKNVLAQVGELTDDQKAKLSDPKFLLALMDKNGEIDKSAIKFAFRDDPYFKSKFALISNEVDNGVASENKLKDETAQAERAKKLAEADAEYAKKYEEQQKIKADLKPYFDVLGMAGSITEDAKTNKSAALLSEKCKSLNKGEADKDDKELYLPWAEAILNSGDTHLVTLSYGNHGLSEYLLIDQNNPTSEANRNKVAAYLRCANDELPVDKKLSPGEIKRNIRFISSYRKE